MASPAPPACRQDGHHEPDRVIAIAWNGCSTLAGSAVRHRRNAQPGQDLSESGRSQGLRQCRGPLCREDGSLVPSTPTRAS